MLHKSLSFVMAIFSCATMYGQDGPSVNINSLSPQTYEFVKYGSVPVSHFTGESNVQVPLYTYSDRDFELPLYLGYNSSGFVPGKREGIVGLNWFLNAGGVITRRVNGWPDEREGKPNTIPTELHGLYYGIKNNLAVKNKTKEQVFNPSNGTVTVTAYWNISGCEVNPDDFNFNMPGFSGRFFIENNGSVRTVGNKPYKIDLTGFGIQPNYQTDVLDSEIIITTDNGYTYYFGGNLQYLEVSYPFEENEESGYPVINAWHLRKIQAPNGRSVTFEYKQFTAGITGGREPDDPYHYLLSVYDVQYSTSESTCNSFLGGTCSYNGGSSGTATVREFTKTVYLEKVKVDDKIVFDFSYGEKDHKFYTDESRVNQKTLRLNSIVVKDKNSNQTLRNIEFGYQYLGGTQGQRMFMTSVKNGDEQYTFSYYKTDQIPNPKTRGIDHWGYWNGGYATTTALIPNVKFYSNGDVDIPTGIRDADPTKCDVGLLEKIVYPTGGYSKFIYEGHTYSKRLERRSQDNFIPKLYNVIGAAGGARIQKIINHDGKSETNIRTFYYSNNYPSIAESSGILLSWPRYIYYWKYDDGYTVQHIMRRKSTSYNVNYYPGEHFIQYKEVSEVVASSNGYTNYKFTNFESHPDFNEYNTSVTLPSTQQYITNVHLYNSYVGIKLNERSFERGLPKEVTVFASSGGNYVQVKKTTTEYQTMNNNSDNYVAAVHQTGGIAQSFKLYYYPVQLLSQTEISFGENESDMHSTLTTCTYNNLNYLQTKSINLSDGKTRVTKIKYPTDFISDSDDAVLFSSIQPKYSTLPPEIKALVDLKKNNILNRPVEIIDYLNGKVISASLTYFKDFGSANLSKFVYPYQQWSLQVAEPLTTYTESSLSKDATWKFNKDAGYASQPEYTYNDYDEVGNLKEVTGKHFEKKSYKWSYDKLYPIAESIGTTYNDFFFTSFEEDNEGNSNSGDSHTGLKSRTGGYSKVLSGMTPGSYTLQYWEKQPDSRWVPVSREVLVTATSYTITLDGQVDDIRLFPAKDSVQLKTYTYRSGFGMTSFTDANNITVHYEYDGLQRLKAIRDDNRNIVKALNYNFQKNP